MNGAVYISFFQGQLESVLEQVVQLAVQEISKTVGSSLNALLLETAVKEQENRRLRLQLQARENRGRGAAEDGGSAGAAKAKAGELRGDGRRTKPSPPLPSPRAPGGQGGARAVPFDTRRLEQRGRVVDQLKVVMEQVLDFALRELTKIVEASVDNLLQDISKMDREQQALEEKLGGNVEQGRGEKSRGGPGRRRGSENDSVSPSGSEDTRGEPGEASKATPPTDDTERAPALSAPQDWVPVLDKVFGQKWCSDMWQMKELEGGGTGCGLGEEGGDRKVPVPAPPAIPEPSPSSPQQDPRWTPLEDMEVFSPDEGDTAEAQRSSSSTGPPLSPTGEGAAPTANEPSAAILAEAPPSSGNCSSASMLHRLLTLPSQLLEEEDEAADKEALVSLATNGSNDWRGDSELPVPTAKEEEEDEEEEEEEDEEDKGRKKRRRVWSECEECGRRFSRMSLLKAHRQTHASADGATDAPSPSSPPSSATSPLRCSECGRRFSSSTRLNSHMRTHHENRS
ncbi:uncharacterized protein LOC101171055 isoform X2 [Oryzias latipes]|uniref:uncharacterized protein LOC101171055 isoform X2 n=1 Tax=Oryzias latipes TaxID=8090 RepID=UPI000CE22B71|nr:uncharacterized protein LOC101171055 isoform X2 [Oryzias latipes]